MIDVHDEPPNFAERVCKKFHASIPMALFDAKVGLPMTVSRITTLAEPVSTPLRRPGGVKSSILVQVQSIHGDAK
jgi:hypothetical protein